MERTAKLELQGLDDLASRDIQGIVQPPHEVADRGLGDAGISSETRGPAKALARDVRHDRGD